MTQPAPEPLAPEALLNDPILGPMLQSDPALLSAMMGGGALGVEPPSLTEALVDSAMTTVGREGITGSRFTGELPPWAQDLAPQVLKNPDFDPYFGIVSEEGDERVYMGERMTKPESLGAEPIRPGMKRSDVADDGNIHWSEKVASEIDKLGDPDQPEFTGEPEFRSGGQLPADRVQTPSEKKRKPEKAEKVDRTLTALQAANLPYTWDEGEIAEAMKRMRQAGIPVDSFDMSENSLVSVWGSLVARAAMTYAMSEGDRKVTPWDVLDLYKSEAKAAGTYQNLDGNQTRTTVQRTVSDITEGEAWSVLQSQLSRMLGRDPTDQEVRDFSYRMNQLAAANPSISKTITKYKNGEEVSSSVKETDGLTDYDIQQSAYEQAQSDPDYAEFQAATTYFNSAMSALGAIGEG